ncbi:hypothetical protein [Candidatus Hepatobacter penaei]|uniref:hypothetical protein n=1 Tax=Candidatus Hepatobacter penaei TaxID=1274402 RepID=UPI0012E0ABFD|nr:hypothetical protein [Candidatus Hepatobacter penaei]
MGTFLKLYRDGLRMRAFFFFFFTLLFAFHVEAVHEVHILQEGHTVLTPSLRKGVVEVHLPGREARAAILKNEAFKELERDRLANVIPREPQDVHKAQVIHFEKPLARTEKEKKALEAWDEVAWFHPVGLARGAVHTDKPFACRTVASGVPKEQRVTFSAYHDSRHIAQDDDLWKAIDARELDGHGVSTVTSCSCGLLSSLRMFFSDERRGGLILDLKSHNILAASPHDLSTPQSIELQSTERFVYKSGDCEDLSLYAAMNQGIQRPQDVMTKGWLASWFLGPWNEIFYTPYDTDVTGIFVLTSAKTMKELKASSLWAQYAPFVSYAAEHDLPVVGIHLDDEPRLMESIKARVATCKQGFQDFVKRCQNSFHRAFSFMQQPSREEENI